MSICHNKQYEREFVRMMTKLDIDCHRVAGSGSASEAVCDCIMFYQGKTCLVEVKATKEIKFYMRSGIVEQLQRMIAVCDKNGLIPVLAVKFKQRGWNMLSIKNFENFEFNKEVVVNADSRPDKIFS